MGKAPGFVTVERSDARVVDRPLDGDADWWRLRGLLAEVVPLVRPGFVWDVRRLDGTRFYDEDPEHNPDWQTDVQLWVTRDGRLVGAVNHESRGHAHLQVHPGFRHLEEEMIGWAEERLAAPMEAVSRKALALDVFEYDVARQGLLRSRGYERTENWAVTRHMRLGGRALSQPAVSEGYVLRPTHSGDPDDCRRIAGLLNAAFGRTRHTAEEYEAFTRLAPSFVAELDLAAVAPDGTFAAYVGVPYDDANHRGIFEPVCTHPDHRRRGLALALMQEGLRRLEAHGGRDVVVETGEAAAANALYEGLGFSEAYRAYRWTKTL